ncbi:MAG TPA: sigma 54-interacting transcriptional regulator [Candidatus Binatia bacterium]|jgi:DNA-binding NtrC family response regulator
MKRILVIDESEVVRETLALILGREFVVSKRPLGTKGLPLSDIHEEFDLLILGVSPHYGLEAASLVRFAAQLPFTVLFLVDSKTTARVIEHEAQVGCLTKPFNPYELHEKVGQLLARRVISPRADLAARASESRELSQYLDFPFLSRSAATLVRRFAAARLPILIAGEIGCGQNRIVSGILWLKRIAGSRVSINAAEISEEYLAQKSLELSLRRAPQVAATTLVIENLDKSNVSGQSLLLRFLEDTEEKLVQVRYLATANADLLRKVYEGDFAETLYYKLAMLTLKLSPLRERRQDIPIIADWFARNCAKTLGLSEPVLTAEAQNRLSNYLWFGNLSELETVMARTLAWHRKPRIEAGDLFFDFSDYTDTKELGEFAEFTPAGKQAGFDLAEPVLQVDSPAPAANVSANGHGESVDLNVVIHELAHELKNPMVTIKTFAQLLGERYQDENFRSRFQEVVGDDIERMDELLEVMIEFADFAAPRTTKVSLDEKLQSILSELQSESAKRQTRFEWKTNGGRHEVQSDESQLSYILKNVLLASLSQARMGSEIEIHLARAGTLAITYLREGARVTSITHYLDGTSSRPDDPILPLRVLLAKQLLERNGGRFAIDQSASDKETMRMEFPIA